MYQQETVELTRSRWRRDTVGYTVDAGKADPYSISTDKRRLGSNARTRSKVRDVVALDPPQYVECVAKPGREEEYRELREARRRLLNLP